VVASPVSYADTEPARAACSRRSTPRDPREGSAGNRWAASVTPRGVQEDLDLQLGLLHPIEAMVPTHSQKGSAKVPMGCPLDPSPLGP
jgi:hypothetical protein